MSKKGYSFVVLVLLMLCLSISFVQSQNARVLTTVSGIVVDASTNEPLPFASVSFVGSNVGVIANLDGEFKISSYEATEKVQVSILGFESKVISIQKGKVQTIRIKLNQVTTSIDEVVVIGKRERFKKKNNPAIELIDSVIANKKHNKKEEFAYYEYEKYEKLMFALSNVTEDFKKKRVFRDFQFVFNNLDSTKIVGTPLLPVYLEENIADCYYRKSPYSSKSLVKAQKLVGFDGYIDNQGLNDYMKYLYQDIDIYDNNVTVVTNQFLSPVATTATTFYKYFIMDTVLIDNKKCIKLFVSPFNKTDLLFQGFLYVMPQEKYAIKKVELYVNKSINLNWVRSLNIKQEFAKVDSTGWMLTEDEIGVDFGFIDKGMGIYGQRSVSYKNYLLNVQRPDSTYKGVEKKMTLDAEKQDTAYWNAHRHQPLAKSELGVYATMDSVQKVPAFKRTMNIAMLLLTGYRDLGYFEIGPVNTFYSYNPIEGVRVRFGGRTTPKFSKRFTYETYGAYGFTDEKWKYYLGTTYSLTNKSIYEFPVKSIKASYQVDTKIPGQELQFVQEDNVLLSIKRGVNDKLFYNKTARFEYLNEFPNHMSIGASYQYQEQTPGGNIYFNHTDYSSYKNDVDLLTTSEVGLTLRYAPHEKFYQGKKYRIPVPSSYPVLQLQYTLGANFLGNDYNYHNLKFSVSRRFNLSVLGYTDVIWESGKQFGSVPYPLLMIHHANQTYSYQIMSYNLMNFLEFVSDEYTSLNVDHSFNGFIFNKVPLLKRLKFREVATCKILYGRLSDENNPIDHPDLFKFPTDENGVPITYTLEEKPYIEASVGVSNILKLFRVDLVKRLTYLDHPNVSGTGIRVRFKFDF